MPSLQQFYTWTVNACNNQKVGYSQTYRRGQTVNGITYYDCSSLISAGLTYGGFFPEGNPWFTTRTEEDYLIQIGFTEIPLTSEWLPGDIVWRTGHTEVVYTGGISGGGGVTMGAHTANTSLANQVSINSYTGTPSQWEKLYRYNGTVTPLNWISKNNYLTDSEMQNNAFCFYSYMYQAGFTLNSIAGMLGNIERESNINPGLWQNLDYGNYNLGYGLVQWTPATNYTNWANSKGYDITEGNPQCEWLVTMTVTSGQWIETFDYPMSWEEFKTSTDTPENLASAFLKNFERAGVEVEEERRKNARKWYNYLQGLSPYPPGGGTTKKSMSIMFYLFL